MSRVEFSAATKRATWERSGGTCEGTVDVYTGEFVANPAIHRHLIRRCDAPLGHGCFHYDHVDPSWTSGRNDLANCQLLCVPCHKAKTAKDRGDIAKVKRVRDKAIKAKTSRNPMLFGRGSKLKRKIGGKVVLR